MKIKKELNVSKEEFYLFLYNNLKKELNLKKEIKENMIFEKELSTKFNQKIKTSMKILKLNENKEYSLSYISSLGENIVSYFIEEISDTKILITYIEKYVANSIFSKLNNMIMEILFYYNIRKKKINTLKMIENYILEERNK